MSDEFGYFDDFYEEIVDDDVGYDEEADPGPANVTFPDNINFPVPTDVNVNEGFECAINVVGDNNTCVPIQLDFNVTDPPTKDVTELDSKFVSVVVPGFELVSSLITFSKKYHIFICQLCHSPIAKGSCYYHITKKHKNQLWPDTCGNVTAKETGGRALMQDIVDKIAATYENSLEKMPEQVRGKPIEYLKVDSSFMSNVCVENQCLFISKSHDNMVRHVSMYHKVSGTYKSGVDISAIAVPVKVQFLDNKGQRYIILDSSEVFAMPIEKTIPSLPECVSFQELALAAAVAAIDKVEHSDVRNLSLMQALMDQGDIFSGVVEKEFVARALLWDNPGKKDDPMNTVVPDGFVKVLTKGVKTWFDRFSHLYKNTPDFLKTKMADKTRRVMFTKLTSTDKTRYPGPIVIFTHFVLLLTGCVQSAIGADGRKLSTIEIPPDWQINNANICDMSLQLWSEVMVLLQSPLDGDYAFDSALVHKLNALYLAIFARTANFQTTSGISYRDPVDIFLLATASRVWDSNQGSFSVGSVTNQAAALEYVCRSVLLLEGDRMASEQLNTGSDLEAVVTNTTAYVMKYASPADNNVMYIIAGFKKQMRKFKNTAMAQIQFTSMEKKDFLIIATQKKVVFSQLVSGLQAAISDLVNLVKCIVGASVYDDSRFHPENIHDDLASNENGYSFVQDFRNDFEFAWTTLQASAKDSVCPVWRHDFLEKANAINELLLFLIHTTSGGPSRSTTMIHTYLRNTKGVNRCVQIVNGCVFMITNYEKSRMVKQVEDLGAKFVHETVGLCLVHYMVHIKPFQDRLLKKSTEMFVGSERRLFVNRKSATAGPMTAEQYSAVIVVHFKQYCHSDIRLRDFRHIVPCLERAHLSSQESSYPVSLHAQMQHSTATGRIYGGDHNASSQLDSLFLAHMRHLSEKWMRFLQLLPRNAMDECPSVVDPHQLERFVNGSISTLSAETVTKPAANYGPTIVNTYNTINNIVVGADVAVSYASNLLDNNENQLSKIIHACHERKLFGDKIFQHEGVRKSFHAVVSSNVGSYLCICPTGSGKSCFWFYPSITRMEKDERDIVVVIVPLVELLADQMRKSKEYKIPSYKYNKTISMEQNIANLRLNSSDPRKLVLVQIEDVGPCFIKFVTQLVGHRRLFRLIIDECHLLHAHKDFRWGAFQHINNLLLATATVGHVFLTATVAIEHEESLLQILSTHVGNRLLKPTVIRCGSIPANLGFNVKCYPSSDQCFRHFAHNIQLRQCCGGDHLRYIVFVLTIDECKGLSSFLSSCGFRVAQCHSQLDPEARIQNRTWWREGERPVMIATNGMACGVDYPYVLYIGILGGSYDIESVLQMAGRGGRQQGTVCTVDCVYTETDYDRNYQGYCIIHCEPNSVKWFTNNSRCRRSYLSCFLNGHADLCDTSTVPCDICRKNSPSMWPQESSSLIPRPAVPQVVAFSPMVGVHKISPILPPSHQPDLTTAVVNQMEKPSDTAALPYFPFPYTPASSSSLSPTVSPKVHNPYKRQKPSEAIEPYAPRCFTSPQSCAGSGYTQPSSTSASSGAKATVHNGSVNRSTQLQSAEFYGAEEHFVHSYTPQNLCGYCVVASNTMLNWKKQLHKALNHHGCVGSRRLCYICTGCHQKSACVIIKHRVTALYCNHCYLRTSSHGASGKYGKECQNGLNDFVYYICWGLFQLRLQFITGLAAVSKLIIPQDAQGFANWMVKSETKHPCVLNSTRLASCYMKYLEANDCGNKDYTTELPRLEI